MLRPSAQRAVVVGVDGSPDAEAALRWASRYAAETGASVTAVHAVGLLEHGGFKEASTDGARVREIVSGADLDASRVEWRREDGEPCAVLRRIAETEPHVALVVVGTRGAGAHPGAVLGSTSLELAARCPVPLVIVPPDA